MSLPPLAPPRLPPRKKKPQAAPGKGLTPPTAAKPPRRGRGAPTERLAPFASSGALQRQLPPSPGAQPQKGGGGGSRHEDPALPQAGAAAQALSRARPLLGSPGPGLGPGQSLYAAPRRFSLSLPPEALRVLQRRSLQQQQQPPRERRGGLAPPGAAKRPLAGGSVGGGSGDLRALLQVSLLNERRRYDDVEYEEEEEEEESGARSDPGVSPAHEGLVRKCTEWLRGVESAAAPRDRAEKLETLPHLGTL